MRAIRDLIIILVIVARKIGENIEAQAHAIPRLQFQAGDLKTIREIVETIKKSGKNRIAIVGAQRGGTTITARVIAAETGFKYYDELDYDVHDFDRYVELLCRDQVVVQASCMSQRAHELGKDVLVIFVFRNTDDATLSAERVTVVECCTVEAKKFNYDNRTIANAGDVAKLRYDFWRLIQRQRCPNYIEIGYEMLEEHPLFVEKELRKNFSARQWRTKVEEE